MADRAADIVRLFSERGLTLGTAESLTAGLIAATVAGVSGASAVLMGGVVAYDPRVKHEVLGVEQQVIDTLGVVSAECACQMAEGARKALEVDIAVSATGVAGPTGGTPETPVGTVFIGVSCAKETRAEECHFTGGRQRVREQSVAHALGMALAAALGSPPRKGRLPAERSSGFAKGEMARFESKIRSAPPEGAVTER